MSEAINNQMSDAHRNLNEHTVIFSLNCHTPGATKKLKGNQVRVTTNSEGGYEKEIPNEKLNISKVLFRSPELKAITQYMAGVKRRVESEALPADTLKNGMHRIHESKIVAVKNRVQQDIVNLRPLVDAFEEAYPRLQEEAFRDLGSAVEPLDFPEFDKIRAAISIDYNILACQVPARILARISTSLLKEEEEKLLAHMQTTVEQVERGIGLALKKVFDKFTVDLRPGTDGKVKKISDKYMDKVEKMLESLKLGNATDHSGLHSLIEQTKTLLSEGSVEDLNGNLEYRSVIARGFDRLSEELDNLKVTETERMIILQDDEPTIQEETDAGTEAAM